MKHDGWHSGTISVSVEVSLVGYLFLHCYCHAWSTSSNLGTGAIVEQICKITKILKITELFPKRHSPLPTWCLYKNCWKCNDAISNVKSNKNVNYVLSLPPCNHTQPGQTCHVVRPTMNISLLGSMVRVTVCSTRCLPYPAAPLNILYRVYIVCLIIISFTAF